MLSNLHFARFIKKHPTIGEDQRIAEKSIEFGIKFTRVLHQSSEKPVAMNDHPPPRLLPPRLIVPRTTPEILKQTTTSIFSSGQNLLLILLLSFFLLSLRGSVEMATHFLTSFIDNNPSIKSFIDRDNVPPNPTTSTTTTALRQFVQLIRGGIVDDNFLPGDNSFNHQLNATSLILDSFDSQMGFSNFVSDNGIRTSEIVRSTAKMNFRSIKIIQKEEINDSAPFNETGISQTYYQSFLKRFDRELHEYTAITIFILAFAASYWFLVQLFIFTYTKIHGIIFVLVLNDFCKRSYSFAITYSNGSSLAVERLSGSFIVMRWVFRDVFIQLMCFWFLGGIDDPYSQLKIFVWSKFMPFSIMSPWDKGFEKEIYEFKVSCFLLDKLMSFVFDVGAWIVMADSRKNMNEVVQEVWHLLYLMIESATELKCCEYIVCGRNTKWLLTLCFGELFAMAFQSFMEVYFMVAWLMYYLSVKSIDANSRGQPFGQRELKAMLRDVR
ncbi:uncharacterized protein LOC111894092 [Lactuca sativa]|uniref:Uncharacterized protein n=1 Tax=Lactuca sativa TaxID=4236 RepID=A0A9R1X6U8_LACSA|nr:uncharacterized protein LOC111894092 [Lactuca sativa]KAJ0201591.1 hypothetical protein LSAT_V11C600310130 [Lactuca sativa]